MQVSNKLKKISLKILGCIAILLTTMSFKHPIKLTASLIEYNADAKTIKMECKVFIDDFEKSINKTLAKNINVSNLSKEDKVGIEDYFEKYYNITVNGKKLTLNYKASEVMKEYNVLTIKFSENSLAIKKGDKILIENTLFFEEFGYMQSNRITIRIPPHITEDNREATLNNYSISLNI